MNKEVCQHIQSLTELKQPAEGACEDCIKTGSAWVHLRTCQTCGITLCCDASPQKHMTKHHHRSGHPVIISAEPGERWIWCYPDEQFAEY